MGGIIIDMTDIGNKEGEIYPSRWSLERSLSADVPYQVVPRGENAPQTIRVAEALEVAIESQSSVVPTSIDRPPTAADKDSFGSDYLQIMFYVGENGEPAVSTNKKGAGTFRTSARQPGTWVCYAGRSDKPESGNSLSFPQEQHLSREHFMVRYDPAQKTFALTEIIKVADDGRKHPPTNATYYRQIPTETARRWAQLPA